MEEKWRARRVIEVIPRTHNVTSIRVEAGEDGGYKAGQFMRVRLPGDAHKRWLSFSSSPSEKGYVEFTKKITESAFSRELAGLRPGDTVELDYPFGKFTLEGAGSKIAFISGGIGITPIRSMCKYAVDALPGLDIVLVYANRSEKDIVFRAELDEMKRVYPGLRVVHVLCEPAAGFRCTVGLVDVAVIKSEVTDYAQRDFFLCGPPTMVEAMKKLLTADIGLPQGRVITENFTGY